MTRIETLLLALRGEIPWRDVPTVTDSVAVHIQPRDLLPVLGQYIEGTISEKQLQQWADWVLQQDEFCVLGCENDSVSDYYEPMWYVLQQLSTPFVDGPITAKAVQAHVSVLRAL
ncbi:hypothetical protein [Uliginosibacterium sp. TH139]|uniref:hypothetical protein n=1 Tax=Uliginosibacterium sp. TH139 TaxID=2067453 RepID=UPI000C7AC3E6|nr:hypothetical protein [Uliginosibacterium sp. TH139]PLK50154.1 hypothetical protein C0V76_07045 [Uliginosibacterium sp. TH139]